jgi:phosphate transport system protein
VRSHFKRDFAALQQDLALLGALVKRSLDRALTALRDRDAPLARQVVAWDAEADAQENRIHEECLKMLALHQPVAADLRRVVAAVRLASDLERMADLAGHIAERAEHLAGLPSAPPAPAVLWDLADRTMAMVRQGLAALVALDARQARAVCRMDEEVDRLNDRAIAELAVAMKADPAAVETGLSLFSVVRHLERVADHATNIAEGVVYQAEGEQIRHHPEALGD